MSKSVAIVTGASQGIGHSTAVRLARDFSSIVLVARNRANLEETAVAVKAAGAEPLIIALDLAELSAAQTVVDLTLKTFGRIDAVLNIAGAVPQVDLFEMTEEQWNEGMALKLHGARRLTIAAWPALKEARGSVVLMSGNSALFPKAPYAAVGTINAAIIALAKAFSDRGITDDVQVNSVLPGPVMTLGVDSQRDGRRGNHQISERRRYRTLRRTGGNCRAHGIPGLARGAVDDGFDAQDGRGRGEVDLKNEKGARDNSLRTADRLGVPDTIVPSLSFSQSRCCARDHGA